MAQILIIEDNAEVRDNMCDILSLAGYEYLEASEGKKGIQLAISEQPDLILCDIMMPELDGFGVLKILGERDDTRAIPFVFVTAKSEQEDLRRGMNLGADDYVTKPFYKDELLRVLEVRLRKNASVSSRPISLAQPQHWTGFLSEGALDSAMESLLKDCATRTYKRGEAIYREGERVRDVYLLRSGFAKHQATTSFGKTLIVFVFQAGQLFGYPELIAKTAYQHDTIALTDLEVDIIPAESVRNRMASDPNIANLLLGYLANGILDSDQGMMNQSYLSVRKRCANALLRAQSVFGDIAWPMSREELAQWAGTAKETFIRNLTDFKESGFVTTDGSNITVLNATGLENTPG